MKFFLIRLVSHVLNLPPNTLALFLGDVLGFLWFYLVPFRRKIVIENLTLAFGDQKSPQEIEKLAYAFFRHIGKVIIESLRSIVWTKADFKNNITFEGFEHIAPYLKNNQGGFLVSLHLGCWELSPGAGVSQGIPVDVVTKYARNKSADPMLQWFRKRLGVRVIAETKTTPLILESIKSGRWIGFMIDQFMGPPVGIPVNFFGKLAGTTASLAALSEQHHIPCLFAYTYRDSSGRSHTVIEPFRFPNFSQDLTTRIWEKTQFINDALEKQVREHEEQWMWLHRRWKPFNGTPKWNLSHAPSRA